MSGIIGLYTKEEKNISKKIYYGLYALQHRGQESTGMAVNNNGFVDYTKEFGLVHEAYNNETLDRLRGNIGIGHVRSSDTIENITANVEPLVIGYKKGALALANDGNIVNAKEIRDGLEDKGVIFQSNTDSEVMANLIARYHKDDIEEAVIKALETIKGSYTLVIMTTDKLIGVRDPYGMKPLSIGRLGNDYVLSSETCAFDTMGAKLIRDVEPGEIVVINEDGLKSIKFDDTKPKKMCLFEFIYFARPDSKIDGRSIYLARREAGRILAKESPADGDIVISAPDSGTVAAIGYAESSRMPYDEGLIKNRYVGRTFIQPTQELREQGVKIKLNVLDENVKRKKVVLVDDSIVRGTTIKQTVKMIKDAGAKEVHVRISSPPVKYPCFFGLDTSKRKQLIASEKSVEEIREIIGADSLAFLSLEGLIKGAGNDDVFCTGCFNNIYPMNIKEGERNEANL